jgi:hypothetical protein
MEETFQLRLTRREKRLFERSAHNGRMSLAAFLRAAGHEKAARTGQRPACLDYPDDLTLSPEAERNPKAFIRSRLKARNGLHR